MSASSIRAGAAYIEMTLRDNALRKGLDAAQQRLSAFGDSITAAGLKMFAFGAAALGGLGTALKIFADAGSELNDMSARTGVSVEALSELAFAAKLAGAGSEDLETGLRKMSRTLVEAKRGGERAQRSLAALGLSIEDLESLSPEDAFQTIGERLLDIQNPMARAALAMEIFGKTGTKLLPMLDGLGEARQRARELGLTISTDMAQRADQLGDSFDTLGQMARRSAIGIGAALAPAIQRIVDIIISAMKTVNDWITANEELVQVIAGVAAGLAAGGAALVALGVAAKIAAAALAVPLAIISAIGTAISVVAAIIGFLLTPVGLLVAAIVGIGAYFLTMTQTGRSALSSLGQFFASVVEFMKATWGGIVDAIMAGDLALAGQIAMASLRVAWLVTCNWFKEKWESVTGFFGSIWQGFLDLFMSGLGWLRERWNEFMEWLGWSSLSIESRSATRPPRPSGSTPAEQRQAELQAARQELSGLIGRAAQARQDQAQQQQQRARNVQANLDEVVAPKLGAKGTFNAFGAFGLVTSSPLARLVRLNEVMTSEQREIAARARQIAENTDRIQPANFQ